MATTTCSVLSHGYAREARRNELPLSVGAGIAQRERRRPTSDDEIGIEWHSAFGAGAVGRDGKSGERVEVRGLQELPAFGARGGPYTSAATVLTEDRCVNGAQPQFSPHGLQIN